MKNVLHGSQIVSGYYPEFVKPANPNSLLSWALGHLILEGYLVQKIDNDEFEVANSKQHFFCDSAYVIEFAGNLP